MTENSLLQLGFHDCHLYEDGSGGCDGCLNWSGIGMGYSGFPGGDVVRDYAPVATVTAK